MKRNDFSTHSLDSRGLHYSILIIGLALLWVTQVAIPAPCASAGTFQLEGHGDFSGDATIPMEPGESQSIVVSNWRAQCRKCSKISWETARIGPNLTLNIEDLGDTTRFTLTAIGQTRIVDDVQVIGRYDDPIGDINPDPNVETPISVVRRRIAITVKVRLR